MTCIIVGTVQDVSLKELKIEDSNTGEVHNCILNDDALLGVKAGQTGIFCGTYYNGKIRLRKVDVRRFLDPLYEEDLLEKSGEFTLLTVIDDPFPDIFEKLEATKKEDSEKSTKE